MKIRSLYKNLDTVFADLSALLRHLRRNDFIGMVRVEICTYTAVVVFEDSQRVKMREFHEGTGIVVETESGLQRLLSSSKSPGGVINVFEAIKPEVKIDRKDGIGDILDLNHKRSKAEQQTPKPVV